VKQRDFIDLISGKRRGPLAALQRGVLRAASWFFRLGATSRLLLYRVGLLRGARVDAPVICVGNLTTGGTGKTPAVAWVVNALKQAGRKPAIVSRGYKSDESGNDEMKVLDELVPGTPHVQNPDRAAGARKAIAEGADCIVLDDGFSHLGLKRELDILLFDALNPFGYGRLLPRGLLREPLSSVRRAKFAVFTRADVSYKDRLRDLEDTIRCKGFTGGVAHAAHVPVKLVQISDGQELPLSELEGKVVAPFCGIGNPLGFERTLEALGAAICPLGVLRLDDHQKFDERVFSGQVVPFLRSSRESGAVAGVCTQKDAVKFRGSRVDMQAEVPIYELRVEFRVTHNEEGLREVLGAVVNT
jgi:tetraacyldisaccharide 4'-kinase